MPEITGFESVKDLFHTSGEEGRVVLIGTNFGPKTGGYPNNKVVAVLANPRLEGMPGNGILADCNVTKTQYSMVCRIPEGVGYDLMWSARVGAQDSDPWLYNTTSYFPPTITSVMPRYGDKYLSTDGNESVIITGTEFGPNISSNENFIYGECIPRLSNQEITKKSSTRRPQFYRRSSGARH